MQFVFNERKAGQAAARLLRRDGRPMPDDFLIALLYLADRQSLIQTGRPITGDQPVSARFGPDLCRIRELANAGPSANDSPWRESVYASVSGCIHHTVQGTEDLLSEYECSVLDGVFAQFGWMNPWDLTAHLQQLPEWIPMQEGARPIDIAVILESAGYLQDTGSGRLTHASNASATPSHHNG